MDTSKVEDVTKGRPPGPTPDFSEIGSTGLNRYQGYVDEEFLPALKGTKAIKIYREMASNDPIIGAMLYASEQLLKRTVYRVEAQGESPVDLEAKEFLESCFEDMSLTWSETLTEILSMMTFGWSYHEIVYKRRLGDNRDPRLNSLFIDGRIGWKKLSGRAQETLDCWDFSDDDEVLGMWQWAPPLFQRKYIPRTKALLFRTRADKNNPEGRSLLRNAYRPWYFKKRIEEIEGIGIERDLAGLPVLQPPDGVDIWNRNDPESVALKTAAEKILRNVRRDQSEGILLPFGWDFKLLTTGSRRQFDTNAIINRYDQRIAITILADVIMLGVEKVGSFALSEVKKGLFAAALETIADIIVDVFNRYAIPKLFAVNVFPGLVKIPKLVHGEIEIPDLEILSNYLKALNEVGIKLAPHLGTENKLREYVNLPLKTEAELTEEIAKDEEKRQAELKAMKTKGGLNDDPDGGKPSNQDIRTGDED